MLSKTIEEFHREELFSRWLNALESGDYEQAEGVLRIGNKFCCLGVLCDQIDPTAWKNPSSADYSEEWYSQDWHKSNTNLPVKAREAAGINSIGAFFWGRALPALEKDPEVFEACIRHVRPGPNTPGASVSLSDLNDKGVSFEMIARVIRAVESTRAWLPMGESAY